MFVIVLLSHLLKLKIRDTELQMQLERARIKNFRSLRDIEVSFGAHTALIRFTPQEWAVLNKFKVLSQAHCQKTAHHSRTAAERACQ